MAKKHDSRSTSPTIEGIEQPNKNYFLGVGLRAETSGLEATLGNINNNMAKNLMSSLLEMRYSSRQQSLALTTIILCLANGLRAIIQMMM